MVAVALGSTSTAGLSGSLPPALWMVRLSGAVPVVAAAVAARQVSTLGEMATAAGQRTHRFVKCRPPPSLSHRSSFQYVLRASQPSASISLEIFLCCGRRTEPALVGIQHKSSRLCLRGVPSVLLMLFLLRKRSTRRKGPPLGRDSRDVPLEFPAAVLVGTGFLWLFDYSRKEFVIMFGLALLLPAL